MGHIHTFQNGTAQVGASQVGEIEQDIREIGVLECGCTEVSARQIRAPKVLDETGCVGRSQDSFGEIGAAEIRIAETSKNARARKVGSFETGPVERHLVEVCRRRRPQH